MSSRGMRHRSYECEDRGRRAGDREEWKAPFDGGQGLEGAVAPHIS